MNGSKVIISCHTIQMFLLSSNGTPNKIKKGTRKQWTYKKYTAALTPTTLIVSCEREPLKGPSFSPYPTAATTEMKS